MGSTDERPSPSRRAHTPPAKYSSAAFELVLEDKECEFGSNTLARRLEEAAADHGLSVQDLNLVVFDSLGCELPKEAALTRTMFPITLRHRPLKAVKAARDLYSEEESSFSFGEETPLSLLERRRTAD